MEYREAIKDLVNTDNLNRVEVFKEPHLCVGNLLFVNMPNPYNACFVLDAELAAEYVRTSSFDKVKSAFQPWGIRERAAMGLCFENIPPSFNSRYVVPVSVQSGTAPKYSWIFHLPNNYANDGSNFGKIPMKSLFVFP